MKRSITTWTTTLATAALLGLPGAAIAKPQQPYSPPREQQPAPKPTQPQQPPAQPTQPPSEPQPTQPTPPPAQPAPQPTQPQPTEPQQQPQPTTPPATSQPQASTTGADQSSSPEEHLRQAREALNSIKSTSIPASDRTQFAELRRHLAALDNPSAASSTSSKTTASSAKADNWGTEVAAIDRIITTMAGSDTTTGASSTSTAGATGTAGRSSAALDEATRSKLMDIRTHITAYAAAKSGTASTPRSDKEMSAATNETPAAAQSTTPAQTEPASPTPANPNPANPTPASPAPANPAQDTPAQPPAATPQAAAPAPTVNAEAAHRELLAARDALNQVTQLPAAAQLSGESRTQVQQLITNFNELITNTTDWRASYAKVESSLNTLLGPSTGDAGATDANPAPTPAPTTTPANPANPANPTNPSNPANPTSPTNPANPATPDNPTAVGTSGTAQLDPAIRAKLVEMRSHLVEFQKASGGAEK